MAFFRGLRQFIDYLIGIAVYLLAGALVHILIYGAPIWSSITTWGVVVFWPAVLLFYAIAWIFAAALVVCIIGAMVIGAMRLKSNWRIGQMRREIRRKRKQYGV